ncbi:hypothetical protein G6N05_05405 [Flavobacterium sp. F372]|uniref:DUF4265 domain-containing protein n=1 Tax=Flavobacterium bernardetii TaxID=2813823 RepID=A0ABR7J278_9FLAO|nr:hypothetical protein [Flavobacterium bernardetii]MBC5835817.1 hypothetical protein [Flavobacterium bernardetii]NHF69547.1 hypothetical protein [Flavobacterium bernardetii]
MKVRIINFENFGGVYSDDFLLENENNVINGELVSEWTLTEILPNTQFKTPKWNGSNWYEAYVEVIVVPEEISRMKFKIQIRRSTIYSYDIILTYMQNLAVTELFTQDDKDELIDRLEDAVSFNRYHKDFINLANMLSVSDEIKDEIFIEGNKIQ